MEIRIYKPISMSSLRRHAISAAIDDLKCVHFEGNNMKFRGAFFIVIVALYVSSGSVLALPLSGAGLIGASAENQMAHSIGVVCDAWGRCWQTGPYFGGGVYTGATVGIAVMVAMAGIEATMVKDGSEDGVAAGVVVTGMDENGTAGAGAMTTEAQCFSGVD